MNSFFYLSFQFLGEDTLDIISNASWLVIGLALFIYGFVELRKRNQIRDTPTSKIRSMAAGLVEISGVVRAADRTLRSPLTDRECVIYRYKVEEWDTDDLEWGTLASHTECAPFLIDDGTGEALVDPDGAELRLRVDNEYRVEGHEKNSPPVRHFLEKGAAGGT